MAAHITIQLNADDDAMVGGEGWGEYDAHSSVSQFAQQVADAVAKAYPGSRITVTPEFSLVSTKISGVEDDEYIREIISGVWQSWNWLVA